ncbi:MAG: putative Methyltransferase type 11 [Myxococcales bacterium]|nr:putative Methyltransferase type 11 [Myxococcales bacterium]
MGSYLDRHAELYDLFYADKPYAEEAAFVAESLAAHGVLPGARVLELACGTGRHAFELERKGYEVVATDYSADMLACAKRAKESRGSRVELLEQDMRALKVPGAPFDAVVSLFDSIGYVQTNEAVLQVLTGARAHLRPGGLLVVEFWHAAAMLRSYDPVRVRRWDTPQGEIIRISETKLDCERQLAHVSYSIMEIAKDGALRSLKETQTNRYFLVQEMSGWLERAGFEPLRWCSGFDRERPIDGETWHVVVTARRRT